MEKLKMKFLELFCKLLIFGHAENFFLSTCVDRFESVSFACPLEKATFVGINESQHSTKSEEKVLLFLVEKFCLLRQQNRKRNSQAQTSENRANHIKYDSHQNSRFFIFSDKCCCFDFISLLFVIILTIIY